MPLSAQLGKSLLGESRDIPGGRSGGFAPGIAEGHDSAFPAADRGDGKTVWRMTESEFASYTNYRYWPEMLSPGMLPPEMRDAIIAYRTSHGGEVAGTTRLEDVLDDWPYAHYAWGLLEAGQIEHYLLGFYGHLAYHQTPGTFTAYESVAIKGDSKRDYSSRLLRAGGVGGAAVAAMDDRVGAVGQPGVMAGAGSAQEVV